MACTPVTIARDARHAVLLSGVLLILGGCATMHSPKHTASTSTAPTSDRQSVEPDLYAGDDDTAPANTMRTGRYQLVTLEPTAGQRDLLQQTVTIDLPSAMQLTVADGLQNVLRDSGLQLCSLDASTSPFATPLPAVHRQLGPTTLSDALQVLAGPAWRLRVDFAERTVCFDRRATPASTPTTAATPTHRDEPHA